MELPQNAKVGIAIGCLALAGGIMYFTMFRGEGGGSAGDGKNYLLCANPKCAKSLEMSDKEYTKFIESQGTQGMMMNPMMMGPMVFQCKFCNQKTMVMATKCEKCKNIFIQNMMAGQNGDYADRCPKCKYSAMEQEYKTQK
jgi:ssDNA-binding Zn-finger/Zn-ribbon topoisomerase 1